MELEEAMEALEPHDEERGFMFYGDDDSAVVIDIAYCDRQIEWLSSRDLDKMYFNGYTGNFGVLAFQTIKSEILRRDEAADNDIAVSIKSGWL